MGHHDERFGHYTLSGALPCDILMRPVRNLLSRVRIKMKALGIVPRSMVDTGYLLVPTRELASYDGERRK